MTTVIEAIYENGILRPLAATRLKEQQRYTLIVQEKPKTFSFEEPDADPEFLAEIERRTTILPDGRKVVKWEGIFAKYLEAIPNGEEVLAKTMEEVRRERNAHFEAELDEFFPLTESK